METKQSWPDGIATGEMMFNIITDDLPLRNITNAEIFVFDDNYGDWRYFGFYDNERLFTIDQTQQMIEYENIATGQILKSEITVYFKFEDILYRIMVEKDFNDESTRRDLVSIYQNNHWIQVYDSFQNIELQDKFSPLIERALIEFEGSVV